jgi:hypothetical protein
MAIFRRTQSSQIQQGEHMNWNSKAFAAAAAVAVGMSWSQAQAVEPGGPDWATKPGAFIGSSAGVPPPGIYMFNQVFTYQTNLTGPGTTTALGGSTHTGVHANVDVQGFLFVPGWTFLGATYDAVIVQPFVDVSIGSPVNAQFAGGHNTYIVPIELSWKFGTSGFYAKTGLGIYTPDGTITGVTGNGNNGSPWWTFQPELILSYIKDGWNLSAALYLEVNTANTITQYTSGDVFHADFTATKTIGKWTFGPVAYYVGQVTNDSCTSTTCLLLDGGLGTPQRFNIWAVGGLIGYDFGPASASVWATQEVSAKANCNCVGVDTSLIPQGLTVFATLSYQLWAPPAPTPMIHK